MSGRYYKNHMPSIISKIYALTAIGYSSGAPLCASEGSTPEVFWRCID